MNVMMNVILIMNDDWTYLCASQGMPAELYHLREDPHQANNVIEEKPLLAEVDGFPHRAVWPAIR